RARSRGTALSYSFGRRSRGTALSYSFGRQSRGTALSYSFGRRSRGAALSYSRALPTDHSVLSTQHSLPAAPGGLGALPVVGDVAGLGVEGRVEGADEQVAVLFVDHRLAVRGEVEAGVLVLFGPEEGDNAVGAGRQGQFVQ